MVDKAGHDFISAAACEVCLIHSPPNKITLWPICSSAIVMKQKLENFKISIRIN